MKSVWQLARQPVKTVFGIILVALAVAILCVCVGQAMVAYNFEAALEQSFTTIALPTEIYQIPEDALYIQRTMPMDVSAWISQMTAENPDIIKTVAAPGLSSAYIPDMRQDNCTTDPFNGWATTYRYRNLTSLPTGAPYCTAVLEIKLNEIGEIEENEGKRYLNCVGIVEAIIGLEEGYPDSTGFTIYLSLPLSNSQTIEDLGLETGECYLVFGLDYYDKDWALRVLESEAWETGEISIGALNPDCLTWFSDEEVESYRQWNPAVYNVAQYADYDNNVHFTLTNITADNFRSVSMTAEDYVRLDSTVADFLNSDSDGVWQDHMDCVEINTHAYPVIGVDKLTHLADFVRGVTVITTGREFSREELETGANICLISESLAAVNGLNVGDSITLNFYEYDENCPYQDSLLEGNGVINPGASYFTENTVFAPAEEYIIIGFYQQKYDWYTVEDNIYAISPNTIITPKSAVPVEMQYTNQGLWGALELYNGSMDEFNVLTDEAGHSLLYVCYDQGYSIVKENLQNYDEIAARAVIIGIVVYGNILILFLMMFPARQGDVIHRMSTMGAFWWDKMYYILTSGLGILLPGTVLGTMASVVLWDRVVNTMTAVVVADLDLQLDFGVIFSIAVVQLLLALALTMLISLPMTLGRLMNRR